MLADDRLLLFLKRSQEWRRMIALLDMAGILITIDGAALMMYRLS